MREGGKEARAHIPSSFSLSSSNQPTFPFASHPRHCTIAYSSSSCSTHSTSSCSFFLAFEHSCLSSFQPPESLRESLPPFFYLEDVTQLVGKITDIVPSSPLLDQDAVLPRENVEDDASKFRLLVAIDSRPSSEPGSSFNYTDCQAARLLHDLKNPFATPSRRRVSRIKVRRGSSVPSSDYLLDLPRMDSSADLHLSICSALDIDLQFLRRRRGRETASDSRARPSFVSLPWLLSGLELSWPF